MFDPNVAGVGTINTSGVCSNTGHDQQSCSPVAVSSYTPSCRYVGLRFPLASEHSGVLRNNEAETTSELTEHRSLQTGEPTEQEVFDPFKHRFTAADFEVLIHQPVVVTPVPRRYDGDTTRQHHSVLEFLATVPITDSVLADGSVTQQATMNWPPADTDVKKNENPASGVH